MLLSISWISSKAALISLELLLAGPAHHDAQEAVLYYRTANAELEVKNKQDLLPCVAKYLPPPLLCPVILYVKVLLSVYHYMPTFLYLVWLLLIVNQHT